MTFNTDYDALVKQLGEGFLKGEFALASDIDGAIGKFKTGDHVNVETDEELVRAFNILAAANGGAVAFVTGRPDEFVTRAFAGANAFRATENGAIIKNADGEFISTHALPKISTLRTELIKALAEDSATEEAFLKGDIFIEDFKDGTITVAFTGAVGEDENSDANLAHYKEHIGRVINSVLATDEDWGNGIDIMDSGAKVGNSYIEILPSGLNKSTAVRELMKLDEFQGKRWLTLGDSEPDRPLLAASRATGGVSIGVSSTAPDPMVQFDNPAQGRQLLLDIAEYLIERYPSQFVIPSQQQIKLRA